MFNIFRKIKKQSKTNNITVFQGKGVIDVTNFSAMSPDDSLGYMCGCDISVFQNGQVLIYSDDKKKELLENCSVVDIISSNNNVGNFHPDYITTITILTRTKKLQISFYNQEKKNEFWNALITLQSN